MRFVYTYEQYFRFTVAACTVLAFMSRAAAATPHGESSSGYVEFGAGPAFARYAPIDPELDVPEHRVEHALLYDAGSGYGLELGFGRLDLGLRLSHLHLEAAGSYDAESSDDTFRANYDFIAPAGAARFETRFRSHIDLYLGLTLGIAVLLTEPQGSQTGSELIPIFGTFEGGAVIRLTDWLDARAGVAWVPPVDQLHMLAPQLSLRSRL